MIAPFVEKLVGRFNAMVAQERGSMSIFALFGFAVICLVVGLAIDVTNVHRQKEWITVAADAGAQAGIVALFEQATPEEIQAAALVAVETNAPTSLVGRTVRDVSDVQLVRYDPVTRSLVPGTPNAVRVTLHRDSSVDNPVATGLLRFAGIEEFEITASSVAYYGAPGRCDSSDGIYAKGQVTLTSGNLIGRHYCVHSQTSVWMPQRNTFEEGAGLSMPDLADCQNKCYDTANPGVEDAKFEMNLEMPPVAEHIANVTAAMLAPSSALKTRFFADKVLASDVSALVSARIMNAATSRRLVKGSVVNLTAAQYNDLMYLTNGSLPTGLVYNVDCPDRGNGPTTALSIGGSQDRRNPSRGSNAVETLRQVVLITDCTLDVGSNARIDATLAISTRITSASALTAASGAVVGDPDQNCDASRKVYIMTMSSVHVPADFTASNLALIVNGDINVAANSSASTTEHFGTSFHAEGTIQIPANNTFNSCTDDISGLIPTSRTFKFVMPRV